MYKSLVLLGCVAVSASLALADITVPPGFTVRNIAPALDDQTPRLSAIDDPEFGTGVITAAANNGVVTFRLISPAGTIASLGTFVDASPVLAVRRVRLDEDVVVDGLLHATIQAGNASNQRETAYLTVDSTGNVIERWRRGGPGDCVSFDFEFMFGAPGFPVGAALIDFCVVDGTQLATMDVEYDVTVASLDSLPVGRTDMDVRGFQGDSTGAYGGGILIADSEDQDDVTALYELRDVDQGGSYRLIGQEVPTAARFYGDLAVSNLGPFAGAVFVTETLSDEIQEVDPNGQHTTWATGFTGVSSLSISPDGTLMYVSDLSGVHLIRAIGDEPGPVVLCRDPSAPSSSPLTGASVSAVRVIFNEPVAFGDEDVTIMNGSGEVVGFDASGSGSQFMIIGLADALKGDTYTITVAESVSAVATGQALDGDNDGIAGGNYVFELQHVDSKADLDADGDVDLEDFADFQLQFTGPLVEQLAREARH